MRNAVKLTGNFLRSLELHTMSDTYNSCRHEVGALKVTRVKGNTYKVSFRFPEANAISHFTAPSYHRLKGELVKLYPVAHISH
jgi:hypothetical protein